RREIPAPAEQRQKTVRLARPANAARTEAVFPRVGLLSFSVIQAEKLTITNCLLLQIGDRGNILDITVDDISETDVYSGLDEIRPPALSRRLQHPPRPRRRRKAWLRHHAGNRRAHRRSHENGPRHPLRLPRPHADRRPRRRSPQRKSHRPQAPLLSPHRSRPPCPPGRNRTPPSRRQHRPQKRRPPPTRDQRMNLYRALLMLYPIAFYERHRDEMLCDFADLRAQYRGRRFP